MHVHEKKMLALRRCCFICHDTIPLQIWHRCMYVYSQ